MKHLKYLEEKEKINIKGELFPVNKGDDEYDSWELKTGMKIEHEHTKDDDIAKLIAKHHLNEYPDYYSRLVKMEEEAKEYWKNKK